MQYLTAASIVASLIALPSSVLAAPTPANFVMKVEVLPGAKNQINAERFDGRYISTYHAGAATSDLVLGNKVKADAAVAQLNNTSLQFGLLDPSEPWLVEATGWAGSSEYDWIALTAFPTQSPVTGFSVNSSYLQTPALWGGFGFRVCDWWHEVPQLFMLTGDSPEWDQEKKHQPSSCSDVKLRVEKA